MAKAKKVAQLKVKTGNKVGVLSNLTAALKSTGIDIFHLCAYGMDNEAYFMIVLSNPEKAHDALKSAGYEVTQDSVLEVEFESAAGTLEPVAKKIADAGIDILYIYGTTSDGSKVVGVVSTQDNDKALGVINA